MAERPPDPSQERVTAVFRALAEEQAAKRQPADAARTWASIQARQKLRLYRAPLGRGRMWPLAAMASLMALVAIAALWLYDAGAPALRYELVGGALDDGRIRTADSPATLEFSDGSRIHAERETALEIAVLGEHTVSARLSSGTLQVHVRHSPQTEWRFIAGPHEVRVVGTVFDMSWDPNRERFSLVMYEGRVQVLLPGPLLKTVNAGETLLLPMDENAAVAERPVTEKPVEPPHQTADEAARAAVEAPLPERVAPPSTPLPSAPPKASWSKLVASGRFEEVVRAADALGQDVTLATKDPSELKALAHAARYTGRTLLALRTWKAARERYPSSAAGRQAAFFLGRIHDQDGQPREALRWLTAYLNESSSDVYASEALGRKLMLVRRIEGKAAAVAVAREYLSRFPAGAYAKPARDMISE